MPILFIRALTDISNADPNIAENAQYMADHLRSNLRNICNAYVLLDGDYDRTAIYCSSTPGAYEIKNSPRGDYTIDKDEATNIFMEMCRLFSEQTRLVNY